MVGKVVVVVVVVILGDDLVALPSQEQRWPSGKRTKVTSYVETEL